MKASSCGLVMNKDEIQLSRSKVVFVPSCGLVMNKDEIQPIEFVRQYLRVVVW